MADQRHSAATAMGQVSNCPAAPHKIAFNLAQCDVSDASLPDLRNLIEAIFTTRDVLNGLSQHPRFLRKSNDGIPRLTVAGEILNRMLEEVFDEALSMIVYAAKDLKHDPDDYDSAEARAWLLILYGATMREDLGDLAVEVVQQFSAATYASDLHHGVRIPARGAA